MHVSMRMYVQVKKGDLKEVKQLMSVVPPLPTYAAADDDDTTTSTSQDTHTQDEPAVPLGYGFYIGTPTSPTRPRSSL